MFDIVGKRRWFFGFTIIVVLVCIISLVTLGLEPGVEFSSGSMMTISFEDDVEKEDLQDTLADLGYTGVIIQRVGGDDYLIRLPELLSLIHI